jgi:RimJ/RimL family protein N-acetyltransferase
MLKQIIFILKTDQSSYIKTIIADIGYLGERFSANQVQVSCLVGEKNDVEFNKEILYITDDPDILEKMLAAGHYIIALQHDYNNRADLHKALYAMSEIRDIDFDSFLKAYERLAGLPWHILDTGRLTIRETTIGDVDEFYRIYSNPLITRHMDALFGDIDEEKAYAAEYIRTIYSFYGYGIWTVVLRETGAVIGRAGISMREGHRYPELGFIIDSAHQRKGYAEEALRAILGLAKKELEFDIIQALIQPENIASLKLCHKLGFTEQGTVYLNEKKHLVMILSL